MLQLDLINVANAFEVRAGHILWSGPHIVHSLVGDFAAMDAVADCEGENSTRMMRIQRITADPLFV